MVSGSSSPSLAPSHPENSAYTALAVSSGNLRAVTAQEAFSGRVRVGGGAPASCLHTSSLQEHRHSQLALNKGQTGLRLLARGELIKAAGGWLDAGAVGQRV